MLARLYLTIFVIFSYALASCRPSVTETRSSDPIAPSLVSGNVSNQSEINQGLYVVSPLPSTPPFYSASIAANPTINQDTVFFSAVTISPQPQIDSKTGRRLGQYVIVKGPHFGTLNFYVKSNNNLWDVVYQGFSGYSGFDEFAIQYYEAATATSPVRFSNVMSVKMKVVKQNNPPIIMGPSDIVAPNNDSSPVIVNYQVVDKDHDPVTVIMSGPEGVEFDSKNLVLTWTPGFSKQSSQATLIASDGKVNTTFTVNLGAQMVLSPQKTIYDGKTTTTPFVGYTRYDSNGSNVREQVYNNFFGNFLVYTLYNKGAGAATAYNFVKNSTIDLSSYRYLILSIMYSDGLGTVGPPDRTNAFDFYLADVDQGTLSTMSRKVLAANTYSDTNELILDLAEMTFDGFDLSKVNALVIANTDSTAKTITAKISKIMFLGETQQPLISAKAKVMWVSANQLEVKLKLTDIPSSQITKVVWTLARFDRPAYKFVTTTKPVLAASDYDGWNGGTLSAVVTAGGKSYESDKISIPLALNSTATTGDILKIVDEDIAVSAINPNEELVYNNNLIRAMWAKAHIANTPPTAREALQLIWRNDVTWPYGVIPYTFSGMSTSEQNLVRQIMDYVMQQTGIIFIPSNVYSPRDFVKDPNAVLTIRLMNGSDFSTNSTTGNEILKTATCLSRGLGSGTRLVLLKNSGSSQCLTLSKSGDLPGDSYIRDTILHELTHVMGAAHEQLNAPASDIKFNVIKPWLEDQFTKDMSDLKSTSYDSSSVMHYPRYADTICDPNGPSGTSSAYDYSTISKDVNDVYQKRISALPSACQKNSSWKSNSSCALPCETLPKATFDGIYPPMPSNPNRYSTGDIASLKKLYPLNSLLLTKLALKSTPINVKHANVLTSLSTLMKELGAHPEYLKDATKADHILAKSIMDGLSANLRQTPTASCISGRTDIIAGRKSCHAGPFCLTASTPGNFFLPIVNNLDKSFSVNETNCSVTFDPSMTSVCLTATARGGTANGSQGFVSCRASVTEFIMPTP